MAFERMAEDKFAQIMGRVLSPSRAIESVELLKGRDDHLREIRRAWYQGGRQIFIYGYRGVGKTSLAQTAAHQHQSSDAVPIRVICEQDTTFYRVVHDIFPERFLSTRGRSSKRSMLARASSSAGYPPRSKTQSSAAMRRSPSHSTRRYKSQSFCSTSTPAVP
jgi:Cdc6-like AAA superfamily ATPase